MEIAACERSITATVTVDGRTRQAEGDDSIPKIDIGTRRAANAGTRRIRSRVAVERTSYNCWETLITMDPTPLRGKISIERAVDDCGIAPGPGAGVSC